ncbi:MAG: hypothetical protein FJX75_29110 [Armatimonadetes bacterium]|nr:hypothetical protein [Armatimonadota bacterium]
MREDVRSGEGTLDESKYAIHELVKRRRHLPHWDEPGATYFLTFCVKRGVAADLTRPELAELVVGALRFRDGSRYWLYDYIVMPEHVHAILKPIVHEGRTEPMCEIMAGLKWWTARRINPLLGRRGPFWQDETYNRIIRTRREYNARATYILENAHVRGLVGDPVEWPWWGHGASLP